MEIETDSSDEQALWPIAIHAVTQWSSAIQRVRTTLFEFQEVRHSTTKASSDDLTVQLDYLVHEAEQRASQADEAMRVVEQAMTRGAPKSMDWPTRPTAGQRETAHSRTTSLVYRRWVRNDHRTYYKHSINAYKTTWSELQAQVATTRSETVADQSTTQDTTIQHASNLCSSLESVLETARHRLAQIQASNSYHSDEDGTFDSQTATHDLKHVVHALTQRKEFYLPALMRAREALVALAAHVHHGHLVSSLQQLDAHHSTLLMDLASFDQEATRSGLEYTHHDEPNWRGTIRGPVFGILNPAQSWSRTSPSRYRRRGSGYTQHFGLHLPFHLAIDIELMSSIVVHLTCVD